MTDQPWTEAEIAGAKALAVENEDEGRQPRDDDYVWNLYLHDARAVLDAAGAGLRAEIKRLEWFEDDWKLNDGAQYQENAEAEKLLDPQQIQAWEDARRGDVRSFSKRLATLAAQVRGAGDPS